jgi:hypothetical protein
MRTHTLSLNLPFFSYIPLFKSAIADVDTTDRDTAATRN